MIPTCEPDVSSRDRAAVDAALGLGHITAGPEIALFEARIAERVGLPYAVATSSGSAALHLALLALGIGPGDKVIVPSLTFIATAEAVVHCGAEPVFVDSERETWGIDPDCVRQTLLTTYKVKAVVATHLYGHPCNLPRLKQHCLSMGIPLVEDACEALGASPIGLGDITCLSFNGNKIITTGGGGMALTAAPELAARMRSAASHERLEGVEYLHSRIGHNYRLSAFQAALGLSQLERLDAFMRAKWETWTDYRTMLFPKIRWQDGNLNDIHTFWMPAALLDRPAAPVIARLQAEGIGARAVWHPLHRQPPFAAAARARCEVAEDLWRRGLILPCSTSITSEERAAVGAALRRALDTADAAPPPPASGC